MKRSKAIRSDYCLHCHRDLPDSSEKSRQCLHCNSNNLNSDYQVTWSLSPELIAGQEKRQRFAVTFFFVGTPLVAILLNFLVPVGAVFLFCFFLTFAGWFAADKSLKQKPHLGPWALSIFFAFIMGFAYLATASNLSSIPPLGIILERAVWPSAYLFSLIGVILVTLGFVVSLYYALTAKSRRVLAISQAVDLDLIKRHRQVLLSLLRWNGGFHR